MKSVFCALLILLTIPAGCSKDKENNVRIIKNFDDGWLFTKGDVSSAHSVVFRETGWKQLDLPHDWSVEGKIQQTNPSGAAGGFFPGGVGWYRKHFTISPEHQNKQVFIQFDGIYRNSDVWVNGEYVGHRFYGYIGHFYNITPFIRFGRDNVIAVKVDVSQQPTDRWYSGSGIYRHAWLKIMDKVFVPIWGTYITTPHVEKTDADVRIETDIQNDSDTDADCRVLTSIYNPKGKKITKGETVFRVLAKDVLTIQQNFRVYVPKLWTLDNPVMYEAVSLVYKDDELVDVYKTPFGIRKIEWSPDKGFLLNDEIVKLKGVCLHHDAGNLGAAVPQAVWERRLLILKNMGINSVRLAHNPHAPEVLDLCDRLGILVYDELYDKWEMPPFDQTFETQNQFENNWRNDLTDFINRDRNHPSVILWSMGNETGEQLKNPERAVEIYNEMAYHTRQQEPTRMVTVALHPGSERNELPSRLIHKSDIVSYNYRTDMFEEWRQNNPNYLWIASETKPYNPEIPEDWAHVDFSPNSWFDVQDWVAGQYIWAGIDYLGESRGWPDKGIRSGLLYTTGYRKPYSYFTESIYSEKPMVHITTLDDSLLKQLNSSDSKHGKWYGPPVADHWTFPEKLNQNAKVFTFTNCEEVELLLNGKSLGRKQLADFNDRVIRWEFPYAMGEIKAIGLNDGKKVTEHKISSAGHPVKIKLEKWIEKRSETSKGIAQIEIQITDQNGVLIPRAANLLQFSVEGPAKIISVDNGDMSDHSDPKGNAIQCRGGRAFVVLQGTGQKGNVKFTANSGSLESGEEFFSF